MSVHDKQAGNFLNLVPTHQEPTPAPTSDAEARQTLSAGPSEAQWLFHKDIIIGLYRHTNMKQLQKEMESQYMFKATKRMYDRRFRKWNVAKNLKRPEKVKMLRNLEDNPSAGSAASLLSQHDWNKIARFQRLEVQKIQRMKEVLAASIDARRSSITSPTPVLMKSPRDGIQPRTTYRILRNVEICCQIQLEDTAKLGSYGNLGSESLAGRTPRLFWDKVKHSIYSSKKGTSQPSTNVVESQVPMTNTSYESFDFVWELLATLSPVNTACCIELRQTLLSQLWITVASTLHVSHPVAELCGLLYQCTEAIEVTDSALLKAWNHFGRKLGYLHPTTCRLRRSIIDIARRGRRLDAAESMAQDLFDKTCSNGLNSYLARSCARSLSHVLMALGRFDDARDVCQAIVHSTTPVMDPCMYDERATQAMEDLAEIELLSGNVLASLWSLQLARTAAERLWPGSLALQTMDEKLSLGCYALLL
ncbi:uncharacterized protein CCOS01_13324 [Colletotrichum costaricense]|uniref:Clr5 domain-containing protein n=1 Tax=Colletotrichum costaricense TaxID=1209916 RepID=A0AAI9YLE2_9PEZI|nr:uncharacterized protein CCOS01_13324 [Colletotrichum costaricense]KAK1515131.1 hypothetical protein CCOS01_13324 [Colletotrichum costaricense]